jgi:superfamily II DNA or RNA helicase
MTAVISKYGITIDNIDETTKKQLKKLCSIEVPPSYNTVNYAKQNGIIAKNEIVEVFYTNGKGQLVLPRSTIMNPSINKHIKTINIALDNPGELLPAEREFGIELMGNQEVVINCIMNNYLNNTKINSNIATALLQLGTGSGKTYVGAAIINNIGRKTLWVLPNTSILEQTADVLEVAFPTLKIGRWFSHQRDNPAECHILLILVDSLVSISKTGYVEITTREISEGKKRPKKITRNYSISEWMSNFGMTVFDEIHMYTGQVFSTIFWFFSSNIVFGMSATVSENKNGLDEIYKMHFGREIIGALVPGFQNTDLAWKRRLKLIRYFGKDPYIKPVINVYTGNVSFLETVSQLIKDPDRNKLIISCIEEAVSDNHSVFIFTEYRSHAVALARLYNKSVTAKNQDILVEVDESEPESEPIISSGQSSKSEPDEISGQSSKSEPTVSSNQLIPSINPPSINPPINPSNAPPMFPPFTIQLIPSITSELIPSFTQHLVPSITPQINLSTTPQINQSNNYTKQNIVNMVSTTEVDIINKKISNNNSVVLVGGTSEQTVNIARTKSKVIFTTYSYCAVGVSITSMSALILASPRKSNLQQITGRIERRGGDINKERVVYDIVDQLSPLNKQYHTRKLVYKNKEYIIEEKM